MQVVTAVKRPLSSPSLQLSPTTRISAESVGSTFSDDMILFVSVGSALPGCLFCTVLLGNSYEASPWARKLVRRPDSLVKKFKHWTGSQTRAAHTWLETSCFPSNAGLRIQPSLITRTQLMTTEVVLLVHERFKMPETKPGETDYEVAHLLRHDFVPQLRCIR